MARAGDHQDSSAEFHAQRLGIKRRVSIQTERRIDFFYLNRRVSYQQRRLRVTESAAVAVIMGRGDWVVVFGVFRPEGRRFQSHSNDLGQVNHLQLPV